ncbi:50S ribosomal protein L4 [bacterium]|nr:MAG: 50S ribosomal protein L4 [bacterium]
MAKAKIYDSSGNVSGEVELPDVAFGIEPNEAVMWQYVKTYLANQRRGTHSAKTRGEVRGGGSKPWRQKGTGRARQGTRTSPIWTGGGVVFPPKPRSYRLKFPKKMRKIALASALSDRAKENLVHIFERFEVPEIRTKAVIEILKNAEIDMNRSTLIITDGVKPDLLKCARNIEKLKVTHTGELNTYFVLNAENIIVEKNAISKIEEMCRI